LMAVLTEIIMNGNNLWSANEDSKRIASEIFSRLALVCGYKKLPERATDFIGKTLKVGIRQFEDNWTNNEGQAVTSLKTKIIKMEPSEKKPAAPGEKPPF
jgi:hypothetical protein